MKKFLPMMIVAVMVAPSGGEASSFSKAQVLGSLPSYYRDFKNLKNREAKRALQESGRAQGLSREELEFELGLVEMRSLESYPKADTRLILGLVKSQARILAELDAADHNEVLARLTKDYVSKPETRQAIEQLAERLEFELAPTFAEYHEDTPGNAFVDTVIAVAGVAAGVQALRSAHQAVKSPAQGKRWFERARSRIKAFSQGMKTSRTTKVVVGGVSIPIAGVRAAQVRDEIARRKRSPMKLLSEAQKAAIDLLHEETLKHLDELRHLPESLSGAQVLSLIERHTKAYARISIQKGHLQNVAPQHFTRVGEFEPFSSDLDLWKGALERMQDGIRDGIRSVLKKRAGPY